MDSDIKNKIDELEKRVKFQEAIHHKIKPDGNYYHTIYMSSVRAIVFTVLFSVGLSYLLFGSSKVNQ